MFGCAIVETMQPGGISEYRTDLISSLQEVKQYTSEEKWVKINTQIIKQNKKRVKT